MAEHLDIARGDKNAKYELLLRQIKVMADDAPDLIALMANVAAMIHFTFRFFWTGFYRVEGDELLLGPFQGPLACNRIPFGKGVCGKAWAENRTLIVRDVNNFPDHIACSSDSKSEIVVPIMMQSKIIGVLDIDSDEVGTFDETDGLWLERIAEELGNQNYGAGR